MGNGVKPTSMLSRHIPMICLQRAETAASKSNRVYPKSQANQPDADSGKQMDSKAFKGSVAETFGSAMSMEWVDGEVQLPDLYESHGACAIINIPGYQALLGKLEQRTDNIPDIVEQSLETMFSQVTQLLGDSEVWALEDLSSDFKGLRLPPRCSIGCGRIVDVHLGIDGVRLEHVSLGSALTVALDMMSSDVIAGEVAVSTIMWNLISNTLIGSGLTGTLISSSRKSANELFPSWVSIAWQKTLLGNFEAAKATALQSIEVFSMDEIVKVELNRPECRSARAMIKLYLSDISNWISSGKPPDLGEVKSWRLKPSDRWEVRSIVCYNLKLQQAGGVLNEKQHSEYEIALRLQNVISVIFKCCKSKGMDVLKILPTGTGCFSVICVAGIFPLQSTCHEALAVETSILIREHILKNTLFTGDLTTAICSGRVYIGMLHNESRSDFRILGSLVELAVMLGSLPSEERHVNRIIVNNGIYRAFENSSRVGYLSDTRTILLHRGGVVEDIKETSYTIWKASRHVEVTISEIPRISDTVFEESSLGKWEEKPGPSSGTDFKSCHYTLTSLCNDYAETSLQRAIIIEGPAGSGKSFLMREAKSHLERLCIPFCAVKTPELGAYSLLHAFSILIPQLFEHLETYCIGDITKTALGARHVQITDSESAMTKHKKNEFETGRFRPRPRPASGIRRFLHSSMVRLDFSRNYKVSPEPQDATQNEYIGLVRGWFEMVGIDSNEMLPLMNSVLPINVPENDFTSNIGSEGRVIVLSRILVQLFNYFTNRKHLAILIDEAERSQGNAQSPMGHQDINDFIVQALSGRVFSVDENLLRVIGNQTSGSPLHVNMIVSYLDEASDPHLIFTNGKLEMAGVEEDVLKAITGDMQEATKQLFKRLRSKDFKHLLKCASIIGNNFSLEEIACIWDEPTFDPNIASRQIVSPVDRKTIKKLSMLIFLYDSFDFLYRVASPLEGEDRLNPLQSMYAFRNGSTREAIYTLNTDSTILRSRHARLVAFYEGVITDSTETVFIPLLCLHHQKASLTNRTALLKRIQYLEMMGMYMVTRTQSYIEARSVYNELQQTITKSSMEENFGNNLLADWHIRLAFSYGHGIQREVDPATSLKHAKVALNLLKVNWPATDTAWLTLLTQETSLLLVNMLSFYIFVKPRQAFRRKRGLSQTQMKDDRYSRKEGTPFEQHGQLNKALKLQPLLNLISNHLFRTHARLRDQISFDLYSLNVALRIGQHVKNARGKLFASLALKYWFMGGWDFLSTLLLNGALKHLSSGNEDMFDPIVYASISLHLNARGDWLSAEKYSESGMEQCFRKGDMKSWLVCASQLAFMKIYSGDLKAAESLEVRCCLESDLNGLRQGYVWGKAISSIIFIFMGQYHLVTRLQETVFKGYSTASFQQKAVIDGIKAFTDLSQGNINESIDAIERIVTYLPKMHYTNNQGMHGLFLAVIIVLRIMEEYFEVLPRNGSKKSSRSRSASVQPSETVRKPTILKRPKSVSPSPGKEYTAANTSVHTKDSERPLNRSFMGSIRRSVISHSSPEVAIIRKRLRVFASKTLESIKPFRRHSFASVIVAILRATILALDVSFKSAAFSLNSSALIAWKAWTYAGRSSQFQKEAMLAREFLNKAGVKFLSVLDMNENSAQ
ncbi:hypothetical protein HDU67_005352 [Dinochytrium kinnereticum]|nr:hypothetical protein HDU67_005352 [Dinochytrium kinnereticum]